MPQSFAVKFTKNTPAFCQQCKKVRLQNIAGNYRYEGPAYGKLKFHGKMNKAPTLGSPLRGSMVKPIASDAQIYLGKLWPHEDDFHKF